MSRCLLFLFLVIGPPSASSKFVLDAAARLTSNVIASSQMKAHLGNDSASPTPIDVSKKEQQNLKHLSSEKLQKEETRVLLNETLKEEEGRKNRRYMLEDSCLISAAIYCSFNEPLFFFPLVLSSLLIEALDLSPYLYRGLTAMLRSFTHTVEDIVLSIPRALSLSVGNTKSKHVNNVTGNVTIGNSENKLTLVVPGADLRKKALIEASHRKNKVYQSQRNDRRIATQAICLFLTAFHCVNTSHKTPSYEATNIFREDFERLFCAIVVWPFMIGVSFCFLPLIALGFFLW